MVSHTYSLCVVMVTTCRLVLVKWVVVAYAGITMATIILSDIITIIPLFAAIWLLGSGVGMLSILTVSGCGLTVT